MQILLWKSFEYQTLLFTFTFIFVIIFGTRNLKKDEELGEDVKAEEVEKKTSKYFTSFVWNLWHVCQRVRSISILDNNKKIYFYCIQMKWKYIRKATKI